MFSFWAEGAYITWGTVHEAMSDHLVLPLETFSTFGTGATFHWTIVWAVALMYLVMGAARVNTF